MGDWVIGDRHRGLACLYVLGGHVIYVRSRWVLAARDLQNHFRGLVAVVDGLELYD